MRSIETILFMGVLTSALPSYAKLEVHEWGTFTSLVGSDGITQNGMYHEDEPLPGFVHGFGELRREPTVPPPAPLPRPCHSKICFDDGFLNRNVVTQKMETPVIYFYSDKEETVDVNVRFPEGVITETYPGPIKTFPTRQNIVSIANGDTTFSIDVLAKKSGAAPFVDPSNIYSHARNVESNMIRSGAEEEKFIFYRGIGRFQPRLVMTSKDGTLSIKAPVDEVPQAAFLIHVDEKGNGRVLNLGVFSPGQTRTVSSHMISALKNHGSQTSHRIVTGEQARGMLADALIKSGLYHDEAYAMINTWNNGYLKVPGLRLLYILPRAEVDRVLPLQISPTPEKLVRSFVGRIEILLDTEENRVLSEILKDREAFRPDVLGRFAEPTLRRVSEVYQSQGRIDMNIANLFERLIQNTATTDLATGVVH